MLSVGEGQEKTHLHLAYHFINRCLQVNRNSGDGQDGIAIMNFLISILENMQGKIDNDLSDIVGFVVGEI